MVFPLNSELWLDARRAVWLPAEQTLAVSDLHFGLAWSERRRGTLLPVETPDDTAARLAELQRDYLPQTIVFLGDLVHATVAVADLARDLGDLLQRLAASSRLVLALGNHDGELAREQHRLNFPLEITDCATIGKHWGIHGDRSNVIPAAAPVLRPRPSSSSSSSGRFGREDEGRGRVRPEDTPRVDGADRPGEGTDAGLGWLLMGHEHPSVTLGDGVASAVKCPCFLVGQRRLILPAFSAWAGGCEIGRRPFLSDVAREHRWEQMVAVVGSKCLPLPFPRQL